MKLVSYLKDAHDQLALLVDGFLFDMESLHPDLPNSMGLFLQYWDDNFPMAAGGELMVKEGTIARGNSADIGSAELLAPVPFPGAWRNAFAFHQHLEAISRSGKNAPGKDHLRHPLFSFGNHHSIRGGGELECMPDHFGQLDFELEVGIVIARQGRNITATEADDYIAGLMIMNGITARSLQSGEDKLHLGAAKGNDFATATGPWLVTTDELKNFEVPPKPGHTGKTWNLHMQCRVNGHTVCEGNLRDMDWTFAELIERASYGTDLYPGDIISSGAVGRGCFLEINGTAALSDPDYHPQWLKEGDAVELEVEGLGLLINQIVKEDSDFSLLQLEKNS